MYATIWARITTNILLDVGGLVDDTGGSTEKPLLKKSDETDEANDEDDEGKEETDPTRYFVVVLLGAVLEKGRTFSA